MAIQCPNCQRTVIKKKGHIHSGKQNYMCLSCGRQFVLNQRIGEPLRMQIRKALLERVSWGGICRIFEISMPWLLRFIDQVIGELPDDLNATVAEGEEDLEVATIEIDEQWSLAMHICHYNQTLTLRI